MSEVSDRAREYVNKKHPSWHDNGVGIVQGSHYRSGFVAGAEWQASQPVTDAQVEAAGDAVYDTGHAYGLNGVESERLARVALEAAARIT